jgi:hypothetical protein
MKEQTELRAKPFGRELPVRRMRENTMLRQALTWIVDAGIFHDLKFHGNTKWQPVDLVVLAVMWAWSDSSTLTAAFAEAHRWALALFGRVAVESYQGLTGALVTWTAQLLPLLWERFHQRMEECGRRCRLRRL